MLRYTNKFRKEHNMEELYNLPSLQKAADLQVLHMCKKSKLTHDGPSGEGFNLAGRLKKFDFVGLNIGENIAKQENDDYKEVVKLWMKSEEHRNNILGDYVYSGVSTCIGKDGNRYWAQVFGKDISNTKIAKMRNEGKPLICLECNMKDEDKSDRERKTHEEGEDLGVGDYIMVVPPEYGKEPEKREGSFGGVYEDARNENVGSIETQPDVESPSRGGKRIPEISLGRKRYPGQNIVRRPKYSSSHERNTRKEERELLSLGDYLIPPQSESTEHPKTSTSTSESLYSTTTQKTVSTVTPSTSIRTSTIPIFTLVFKDSGNSTVVPALQSLIDAIKGTSSQEKSSSSKTVFSVGSTLYSTSGISTFSSSIQSPLSSTTQTSSSSLSSKEAISTVTVTSTARESVTVYLPKYQITTTTTTVPSERKDSKAPQNRDGSFNQGGLRIESPKHLEFIGGAGSGGSISPVVKLDDRHNAGQNEKENDSGNEGGCKEGYNNDGSCILSKSLDDLKLKDTLENLVRKGKIHLHILSDEDCGDKEECYESKNRVDIGIPFSYKL